jgi:DNA-binding CsgD family transcriptional regulator
VPEELSELEAELVARERGLVAARERVVALQRRYQPPEQSAGQPAGPAAVEVVRGPRALHAQFFAIQREAPSQVLGTEGPPYVAVEDDPDQTVETLLKGGLRYRILYDRRALDLPERPYGDVLDVGDGRRVRIGDIPTKLVLTDQPIGFLPLDRDPQSQPVAAMVVRDPVLIEALSALFERYWRRAVPISVRADAGGAGVDRELLPLLVAGLTDREIAAKLGASYRTVRRRVRDLLVRLGAQTRFQAGYHAVRRGWLEGNEGERDDRLVRGRSEPRGGSGGDGLGDRG